MTVDSLDIREILKTASKLPTLPAVALQIVKVANDPTTAAEDISKLLVIDQSLSAKVLRMVNASYYGTRNKVSSIKQAVVILGFETVRTLGLSTAIMDKFGVEDEVEGFSRKEFWKHSLGVAMTARLIARKLGLSRDDQETWYMSGLLHDIGKVVLDQYYPDNFREILRRKNERRISFLQSEKEINTVTHDDIGAFLGGQWGLPANIIASIKYHHDPMGAAAAERMVDGVHFANILTKTRGMGSGGDDDISGLCEPSVARLGLSEQAVGVMVEMEMDKEFEGAKELLDLLSRD